MRSKMSHQSIPSLERYQMDPARFAGPVDHHNEHASLSKLQPLFSFAKKI
jgi:hypothetical protein